MNHLSLAAVPSHRRLLLADANAGFRDVKWRVQKLFVCCQAQWPNRVTSPCDFWIHSCGAQAGCAAVVVAAAAHRGLIRMHLRHLRYMV